MVMGAVALAASAPTLDDGKILGVLDVANAGEIEQGELAMSRTNAPGVRSFARTMIDQHTEAKDEGRAVAKRVGVELEPSPMSNDLKGSSNQIVAVLRPMQKNRFDRAYMEAQITLHKQVLEMIDRHLLPEAASPDVKAFVSDIRTHVAHHLDSAQKTLAKLPTAKTP
jgi:putative membrane protein